MNRPLVLFYFLSASLLFQTACTPKENKAAAPTVKIEKDPSPEQDSKKESGDKNAEKPNPQGPVTTEPNPRKEASASFQVGFSDPSGLEWSRKIGDYSNGCDSNVSADQKCQLLDENGNLVGYSSAVETKNIYTPYSDAAKACEAIGGRLPTASELSKMIYEVRASLERAADTSNYGVSADNMFTELSRLFGITTRDYFIWSANVDIMRGYNNLFESPIVYKTRLFYLSPGILGGNSYQSSERNHARLREYAAVRMSWGSSDDPKPEVTRSSKAATLCVRYSPKSGPVATSTVDRHVSITGAIFEKDASIPGFGQAYRDPSGRIWSQADITTSNKNCEGFGGRVPSQDELVELSKYLGHDTDKGYVWTTSDGKFPMLSGIKYGDVIFSSTKKYFKYEDVYHTYVFNSASGITYTSDEVDDDYVDSSVICVAGPGGPAFTQPKPAPIPPKNPPRKKSKT